MGEQVTATFDLANQIASTTQTNGTVIDEIAYDSFAQILSETNASAGDRFKYMACETGHK